MILLVAACSHFVYQQSAAITGQDLWQVALGINLCLALTLTYRAPLPPQKNFIKQWPWFLPGLGVLFTSWLLSYITSGYLLPSLEQLSIDDLWFVTLIPIVEEVLFRGHVSRLLRSRHGVYLGCYLSGIFFALLHNPFSFLELSWGIPLGPLLLAWLCDFLYLKSKHICFSIFFHASCNASAMIFQSMDPKWLEYLHLLYLGN